MVKPDPIAPLVARTPARALELASLALSDGDIDAAVAQYESSAILQPWAAETPPQAEGTARHWLLQFMQLRLPVMLRVHSVLAAEDIALILAERHITGTGPDCERIDLHGRGAAVIRRHSDGSWLIAADAWQLAGIGGSGPG